LRDHDKKESDFMEEWMKQPVSYLKRLVKSRAGRIAELQMEIKILEGIIDRKVRDGDLGGSPRSAPSKSKPNAPAETAAKPAAPEPEKTEEPQAPAAAEEPAKEPEQTKISEKSSSHAFREID
jgi:hypothetical protein